MQLAKPYKQFPAGTPVTIVEQAKPFVTVRIGTLKVMLPMTYIQATPRTNAHIEQWTVPSQILTAFDATHGNIKVQCYCGKVSRYIAHIARHSVERAAIEQCKQECPTCHTS